MRYREFQPGPAVRGFIERYWTLECDAASPIQRVVPDGRPELILHLGEPFESFQDSVWRRQPRQFLAGQITGPLLLRAAGPSKILGIRFHPHGASQALGLPMQEATDLALPLSDLVPALARDLESAAIPTVEAALARHARNDDALVTAGVSRLIQSHGAIDIARLSASLGISTRQFERRFERSVGLSPKLFGRMQRFQRVFHELERVGSNWVETAMTCGYYDQAHLIRDFKDFSGAPPTALLASADLARHFLLHP